MGGHASSLKVSSKSAPHSVAGALAGVLREDPVCEIQVIGAGALNQAVKAIVIARSYLSDDSMDLVCVPLFAEVTIDGKQRTAIRLVVERRALPAGRGEDGERDVALVDDVDVLSEREVPGGLFGTETGRRRTHGR